VELTSSATVWRVDWNTLASPTIPIAEWTFDTHHDATTGAGAWPAGAGVRSPGIDLALTVSSHGARLLDAVSGKVLATFPVTVDMKAQSFVVSVPRTVLQPSGSWVVRLAAGLADATGTGFARPGGGALPTEPAVYDVAFRTNTQEAAYLNPWNDDAQAEALTTGDISAFSATIDWAALAAKRTTPEPMPTGWSDRWYVSSVDLGPGEVTGAAELDNEEPAYLGRVQPYAIYVPTTYRASTPTPLTFLLHSLTQNHNQYAETTPKFTQEACEDRHSICVTTLGRGPSGFFVGTAELDFWEVWHDVATSYNLDPTRTVLSGYSMGGIGTYALAEAHPDLYARAVGLAGASAGDSPYLENLRWIPTYLAGGAADELVPVTDEIAMADGLEDLGYRYRWLLYPAEDHVALELQDGFSDAAAYMSDGTVVSRPGRITFRWSPSWDDPALGLGTTGAYWLRDLAARSTGTDAVIDATSAAQPDPAVTDQLSRNVLVPGDPTPALATTLDWVLGGRPAPRPELSLSLTNVSAVSVLLGPAGFSPGQAYQLDVTTDGPVTLTLVGQGASTIVHLGQGTVHLSEG